MDVAIKKVKRRSNPRHHQRIDINDAGVGVFRVNQDVVVRQVRVGQTSKMEAPHRAGHDCANLQAPAKISFLNLLLNPRGGHSRVFQWFAAHFSAT